MSVLQDDEGSFAAGRQALLDALQSLEQRAKERAERMIREAEQTARQLSLDSEQRAYQLTSEAEERARQTLADAEQRAKQTTLEAATRLAELEQQLSDVRDQLDAARAHIEEQVVAVRGQVEMARASVNTIRQQLTSGSSTRMEQTARVNPLPRSPVSRLAPESSQQARARLEEEVAPSLNDLRAAVDALRQPRRPEPNTEASAEAVGEVSEPAGDETTPNQAQRF